VLDQAETPVSVRYRDGRLEPFEPERIGRQLFAATECVGAPNAFLSRELTESILHFLAADSDGPITTPEQIADVSVKVVRELGHPELARAYQDRRALLIESDSDRTRSTSTNPVFSRDLIHAHSEGLITLGRIDAPAELAGLLLTVPVDRVHESVASARRIVSDFIVIDGPEFDLELVAGEPSTIVQTYTRQLAAAARESALDVILNLNSSTAPLRHAESRGPLFGRDERETHSLRRQETIRQLVDQARESCYTIWWHVQSKGRVHVDETLRTRLIQPVLRTEIAFDRAETVHLGPGIDRRTPAMLMQVGINLPRLIDILGGPPVESPVLLAKIASLTRFAKTAGHSKQAFLRRHGRGEIREGFLLERARLVLSPLGLEEASRACDRPPAETAREIVRTIRAAAENDRPRRTPIQVDTGLDGECWEIGADVDRPWRQRLRSVSALHSAAGAGCFSLNQSDMNSDDCMPETAIEAAAQSAICRLRFRP
jgi:hypothetical protein